jgi:hypothetical protein
LTERGGAFVINMQAAQQIGMQISNSLLLLADRVIE